MASQTGRPPQKCQATNLSLTLPQQCSWLRDWTEFFCLRYSKIQKYSPTESAKVYDKAVNRKSKVHFNPRQTLDYLKSDAANMDLSYETKKNIVKQYLDVSIQYYVLSLFMCCFSVRNM